jgi:hypothetical protein
MVVELILRVWPEEFDRKTTYCRRALLRLPELLDERISPGHPNFERRLLKS